MPVPVVVPEHRPKPTHLWRARTLITSTSNVHVQGRKIGRSRALPIAGGPVCPSPSRSLSCTHKRGRKAPFPPPPPAEHAALDAAHRPHAPAEQAAHAGPRDARRRRSQAAAAARARGDTSSVHYITYRVKHNPRVRPCVDGSRDRGLLTRWQTSVWGGGTCLADRNRASTHRARVCVCVRCASVAGGSRRRGSWCMIAVAVWCVGCLLVSSAGTGCGLCGDTLIVLHCIPLHGALRDTARGRLFG